MFLRRLIRRGIGLLGSCWFISVGAHSIPDSIAVRLQGFASALEQFGKAFPQEKVYLHFDNTSYYQGDPIWFQCYVVEAIRFGFSVMSWLPNLISLQRGVRRCMWSY